MTNAQAATLKVGDRVQAARLAYSASSDAADVEVGTLGVLTRREVGYHEYDWRTDDGRDVLGCSPSFLNFAPTQDSHEAALLQAFGGTP